MKCVLSALLLLALVTGGQAAVGDVGEACATGDTCTDTNAYCDTTDAANKLCKCNRRWIQSGTKCERGATQPCHHSMCHKDLVCSNGACFCDITTVGYDGKGTNGTITCACPTGQVMRASDGKCAKKIDQTCSASTECTTNLVCTSGKCKCDPAKFFAPGSAPDTSCSCDTTKAVTSGSVCKLKVGQGTCKAVSDCTTQTDVSCASGTCTCDASKNLAPNTGGTACACDTNFHLKSDGKCGKVIEQPCGTAAECIDNAVCTGTTTTKCACDTSKNFAAGTTGATSCACDTNFHLKSDKTCGKVIEQPCGTAAECIDNAVCTGATTKCACDTSKNFAAGTTGATSCACDTNFHLKSDGKCGKVIDQTCSDATECFDNLVCTGSPTKCVCDSSKHLTGTAGTTSCACAVKFHLKSDGKCGKVIDEACGTAAECIDNALCTGSKCVCDASKNLAGAAGATSCTCDISKAVDESGTCKLKLNQPGCNQDTDCVTLTGVKCNSGTCDCDASKQLVKKADNTACECDPAKATGSPGSCKLKLDKETCSKDADCESGMGVKCVSGKCGCDTAEKFSLNTGKTACECPTDHIAQAAFDTLPASCVLKVGAACNCSTAQCVFGAFCDIKTGTCLCDVSNNFKAAAAGATSCPCADDSSSMTIGGRTFCGKKIGGSCLLESASGVCASGLTCKSKTISGTAVYGCQCDSGTDTICDGTCGSGADNLAVSIVMLMVGLMTSALVRFLK